jgi:hypothetical protein
VYRHSPFTAHSRDIAGELAMPMSTIMKSTWSRVGQIPATALADDRLQLHHAAQIAVSATISYLPPRPDDSHTALTWSAALGALVTEPIAAARRLRIGLRLANLTLLALDERGETGGSLTLTGRTIADAETWLRSTLVESGFDETRFFSRKHYTIPTHPVANGAPFSARSAELEELARYWGNAASVLDELLQTTPGASTVRTWPHHFDIATLIELPGAPRRTVGVGQSPGDDSYAEPYWYVGPYPYPPDDTLPPLTGRGHWHTKGWIGAALPASAYVDTEDQRAEVATFIDSAVAACRSLLGG